MAADDAWIEGRFEGIYTGERVRDDDDSDDEARRFGFELISGSVESPEPMPAPSAEDAESGAAPPIRQDRVRRVRLLPAQEGLPPREQALFDVRISDWRLKHPAERKGRAYGTVVGRIRARLTPPPAPSPHEPTGGPGEPARPQEAPAAPRPRARRRSVSHGKGVEGPDADAIYRRLRWSAVLALLALASVLVAWRCGREAGVVHASPLLAALVLRGFTRSAALAAPRWQGALGLALVAGQLYWLWPVLDAIWRLGCVTFIGDTLVWVAVPVVLAGWPRSRWPMAATAVLWTAAVCIGCGTSGRACSTPALHAAAADTAPASQPPSRTDPAGRWPAPPAQWPWGVGTPPTLPEGALDLGGDPSATGAASDGAGGTAAPGVGVTGRGDGALDPGAADAAPSPPGHGPPPGTSGGPVSVTDVVPPPRAPRGLDAPSTGPRSGAESPRTTLRQVPGGWVAPDHRRTERQTSRISVEHANRTPSDFFESGGRRRVYLPIDPIFEAGGSRIRRGGGVQLARLAALLALEPDRHVLIEVHSDAGGSPDAQLAVSERRADAIRGWLIDRGHVDAVRFDVAGVGGRLPLVPPDGSWAEQQPNRRIEVRLAE